MQIKLRLLPAEQLHPHEETKPDFLRELTDRIRSDGIIQHPLIVEDKHFTILDGMHRYAALTDLGCNLIPVSLVSYSSPRITVERWLRLVDADDRLHILFDALIPALQIHNLNLRKVGSESYAENLMEERLAFSRLSMKNQVYFIEGTPNSLQEAYELLRELEEALEKENFRISLITESEVQRQLESDGEHCSLTGPRIKKEDVLQAVSTNRIFPPKVTRHVLPIRVFSIDVPLEQLKSKNSDSEASNQAFIETLRSRDRKILPSGQTFEGRFYEEELIVFR